MISGRLLCLSVQLTNHNFCQDWLNPKEMELACVILTEDHLDGEEDEQICQILLKSISKRFKLALCHVRRSYIVTMQAIRRGKAGPTTLGDIRTR